MDRVDKAVSHKLPHLAHSLGEYCGSLLGFDISSVATEFIRASSKHAIPYPMCSGSAYTQTQVVLCQSRAVSQCFFAKTGVLRISSFAVGFCR